MPPRGRPKGSKNSNKKAKSTKKQDNIISKYKCSVCFEEFKTRSDFFKHGDCAKGPGELLEAIDLMAIKVPFSCENCPKKFRFKKSYKEHCKKEHSTLPNCIPCDRCDARCPNKETLDEHIKKAHERDVYACVHCKKEFVRHSHVLRHMAQSGCDGQGVTVYACEICDSTFSRKDNLRVHIRLQHLQLKSHYMCKYCSYTTKNFSKIVNHWHKTHTDPPLQFQCDHCGKSTSSRAAMTKHLEIHGEKKYGCDVCGYSTYTIEVMRRHVLTHVDDKPFKCMLCSKSYIQRVQLQRHLEKHTGNMCTNCGTTHASRAALLIHLREHQGLDKLLCPVNKCAYATKEFINEASLENHLKTHLIDKPYGCEVCGKKFHSELNLRRHLDTHTLERPRRCMYCVSARAYVRGEQLVRHVRKHHAAVFRAHLTHVRQVMGSDHTVERVKKSEVESVLTLLDAESQRILQGCSGTGVLYGGMQDEPATTTASASAPVEDDVKVTSTNSTLMSEEELEDNLNQLLSQLIDQDTLEMFGWPNEPVDVVLEKVIEQCGARAASRDKWTRVQRLRENSKHLFLYVLEDKNIARMLDTHTIDQIIKHILKQVTDDDQKESTIAPEHF